MEFHPDLVAKLRERAERYAELTEQLGDPEIASDPKRFPPLLRERGSLEQLDLLDAYTDHVASFADLGGPLTVAVDAPRTTARMPPRIIVAAIMSRGVISSCTKRIPPAAAMIGTES